MSNNLYGQYTPPAQGGGLFVKLEDGDQAQLRIASEPLIFNKKFDRGGEVSITTRYAWVVWNYQESKAQVFEQGVRFFRAIHNLATTDAWGDPTSYDIQVKREGTGTDTQYHVSPLPNKAALSAEAKEAVTKIDLKKAVGGSGIWLSEAIAGKEVPQSSENVLGDDTTTTAAQEPNYEQPPIESFTDGPDASSNESMV